MHGRSESNHALRKYELSVKLMFYLIPFSFVGAAFLRSGGWLPRKQPNNNNNIWDPEQTSLRLASATQWW